MTAKSRTKVCLHCRETFTERYGASEVQWTRQKYCGYLCLNRAKDHAVPPLAQRFWSRVEKRGPDECWPWTGGCNARGRARFSLDATLRQRFGVKGMSAARVLWFLTYGIWPSADTVTRHTCDNPNCVNPAHILIGTQQDNIADMHARGRHRVPRGIDQGRAKLTDDDVREIRRLLADQVPKLRISKRIGISRQVITRIERGILWRHVQ